jgi:hypothetical protein
MATVHIYSDAQKCKKTGEVTIKVRGGCCCGCKPTIGAILDKDWFQGIHKDQEARQRLFTPVSELKDAKLTCSRDIDIYALKEHLATTK